MTQHPQSSQWIITIIPFIYNARYSRGACCVVIMPSLGHQGHLVDLLTHARMIAPASKPLYTHEWSPLFCTNKKKIFANRTALDEIECFACAIDAIAKLVVSIVSCYKWSSMCDDVIPDTHITQITNNKQLLCSRDTAHRARWAWWCVRESRWARYVINSDVFATLSSYDSVCREYVYV